MERDLLARLRDDYENWSLGSKGPDILREAADLIESLRSELDEARNDALRLGEKLIDTNFSERKLREAYAGILKAQAERPIGIKPGRASAIRQKGESDEG